jgi:ABC-type Fe3+/spermidine/putrescine transport system ATPase subunit
MMTEAMGTGIRVDRLIKRFGSLTVVDDVSFEVAAGQFVVLLGPSGSGKTTILRMIAGLETPTSGHIWLGDVDATWMPPYKRGIGYIFQRPSMFPHYNVFENVAWGLKLRRLGKAAIASRVSEMLAMVHLSGLEDRYVSQLSGGQAQRVAIARALAPDPTMLLLDEPLSMLDAKLRDELKDVIAEVQDRTHKTTVMVTHDQREALSLADMVVVLDDGKIVQMASPRELYRRPASAFVADFVGHNNFLPASVIGVGNDGRLQVRCQGQEMLVASADGLRVGDDALLCLRPDDLEPIEPAERHRYEQVLSGRLHRVVFNGDMVRLDVDIGGQTIRVHAIGPRRFAFLDRQPEKVLLGVGEASLVRDTPER